MFCHQTPCTGRMSPLHFRHGSWLPSLFGIEKAAPEAASALLPVYHTFPYVKVSGSGMKRPYLPADALPCPSASDRMAPHEPQTLRCRRCCAMRPTPSRRSPRPSRPSAGSARRTGRRGARRRCASIAAPTTRSPPSSTSPNARARRSPCRLPRTHTRARPRPTTFSTSCPTPSWKRSAKAATRSSSTSTARW